MQIVKSSGGAEVAKAGTAHGLKKAAKKVPSKQAGKSAAKKAAARKTAGKHADAKRAAKLHEMRGRETGADEAEEGCDLGAAYHHLHRAGAVISLLEAESGADLRSLLEHGIDLYRSAMGRKTGAGRSALCASGLLRATEHLAMAGLYAARKDYRADVKAPALLDLQHHLDTLDSRLDGMKTIRQKEGVRLLSMARSLMGRAVLSDEDPHLRYELVMAADGICSALEAGL